MRKRTCSGFRSTRLNGILERLSPESVEVAGVCTGIRTLHTVCDLRVRSYEVVARRDLVDTYDAPGHDADGFNRFALAHIGDVLGARVE